MSKRKRKGTYCEHSGEHKRCVFCSLKVCQYPDCPRELPTMVLALDMYDMLDRFQRRHLGEQFVAVARAESKYARGMYRHAPPGIVFCSEFCEVKYRLGGKTRHVGKMDRR